MKASWRNKEYLHYYKRHSNSFDESSSNFSYEDYNDYSDYSDYSDYNDYDDYNDVYIDWWMLDYCDKW